MVEVNFPFIIIVPYKDITVKRMMFICISRIANRKLLLKNTCDFSGSYFFEHIKYILHCTEWRLVLRKFSANQYTYKYIFLLNINMLSIYLQAFRFFYDRLLTIEDLLAYYSYWVLRQIHFIHKRQDIVQTRLFPHISFAKRCGPRICKTISGVLVR